MQQPGSLRNIDFQSLFTSAPDLYLVLSPSFSILDATNAYLKATLTIRESVIGVDLFDVFPDNPEDLLADGVSNLRASLNTVLETKKPHKMAIQKYDIRDNNGTFEVRYWSPLNTPLVDEHNEVQFIIHRVEDVTELEIAKINVENQRKKNAALELSEQIHRQNLQESEDRFQKIFNVSPVAIFITDASDGRLMYVNKSFERLFQLHADKAVGKTVIELGIIDKDSRLHMTQHVIEEGGHNVEMEIEVSTSLGELKQVFVSAEMVEIDGKNCFLKTMIDITERKKSEKSLKQTNHFLDTILDNMPSMVIVKNVDDLKLLRMNKSAEEILGVSRDSLLGKTAHDIYPKEQADFFAARDNEVFEKGTLQELEEPLLTKKGERWLHTRKIPVYENGKAVYLLGISQDITEKKGQQDAILELNKELEAFSYSVAHDLRAPLRAITGFAKLLEGDLISVIAPDSLRQLRRISSNAEKMGNLIDDLLAFSKLGKKPMRMEKVNMNQLMDWAIAEIDKVSAHRAELKIAKLHPVRCDFTMMCQVMINLLSNAIKYSSKNEFPVISVNSQIEGNDIVYSISDNGAGFDMRYSDKLFGVFQRLHRADEFEGTGVGLAIVQRIINKHKGRVWAEGHVNKGATFYFSLPSNINHQ